MFGISIAIRCREQKENSFPRSFWQGLKIASQDLDSTGFRLVYPIYQLTPTLPQVDFPAISRIYAAYFYLECERHELHP